MVRSGLLSGSGEKATLCQRLAEHRVLDLAPLRDVVGAYDDDVGGDAQPAQLSAEPDRLRATVVDLGLDHEEVEVAVGAGIASGMRSEQDHLR